MTFGGLRTLFIALFFAVASAIALVVHGLPTEEGDDGWVDRSAPLDEIVFERTAYLEHPMFPSTGIALLAGLAILLLLEAPAYSTRHVVKEASLAELGSAFTGWCVAVFVLGVAAPLVATLNLWAGAATLGAYGLTMRELDRARRSLPSSARELPSSGGGWGQYSVASWDGVWTNRHHNVPPPKTPGEVRVDPRRGRTALDGIRRSRTPGGPTP